MSGRLGIVVGVEVEELNAEDAINAVPGSNADSIGIVTGFLDTSADVVASGVLVVAIVVVVRSLDGSRSSTTLFASIIARLRVRPRRT